MATAPTKRVMFTLPREAWTYLRDLAASRKLSLDRQVQSIVLSHLDHERQSVPKPLCCERPDVAILTACEPPNPVLSSEKPT